MKYGSGDEVMVRCNYLFKSICVKGIIRKVKVFRTYGSYSVKKSLKIVYVELEDGKKITIKDKGKKPFYEKYKIVEVFG